MAQPARMTFQSMFQATIGSLRMYCMQTSCCLTRESPRWADVLVRGLRVATKLVHKADSTVYLVGSKLPGCNLFPSIVHKAHTFSMNLVYASRSIGNYISSHCDEKPCVRAEKQITIKKGCIWKVLSAIELWEVFCVQSRAKDAFPCRLHCDVPYKDRHWFSKDLLLNVPAEDQFPMKCHRRYPEIYAQTCWKGSWKG